MKTERIEQEQDEAADPSQTEYVAAFDMAKKAARVCKGIVGPDPTVPRGADDWLLVCNVIDLQFELVKKPRADHADRSAGSGRSDSEQKRATSPLVNFLSQDL